MTLWIVWKNPGGQLDREPAADPESAVDVLANMIAQAGALHPGDVFEIQGDPDDDA